MRLTLLLILLFLSTSWMTIFAPEPLPSQGQKVQSVRSNRDFIVFRGWVSPMYIENETAPIQVFALVWRGNRPTGESVEVYITIKGLNVNYTYTNNITVQGGRQQVIYLPAMAEGHYKITLYAESHGIRSEPLAQDFGVTKAPIPYECYFTDDGSKLYFHSLKLNETGEPDLNYTFTLYIYIYQHGAGETLVMTLKDVVNITLTIPDSWKMGIVYVDVVDCYGWRNSASIDLQNFIFAGMPLSYDYLYTTREPYKSRSWQYLCLAPVLIIALYVVAAAVARRDIYAE